MPWVDMKEQMERLHIPLYCLESKDSLTDFDIVGFSLEYELCYTNILAMLDLAGIPLRAADRDERWPLIISGGPCVCNAEPMADFFDIMQLGEGEQMLQDICATVEAGKKAGWNKDQLLFELSKIPGVYVPSFYDVTYLPDGRVESIKPNRPGVPERVTKAIVKDMDSFVPPEKFCCAHGGCCAGPCLCGSSARLCARLPVLPGRPAVPPVPRALAQAHQRKRPCAVPQHRVR